ncbi:MAG: DUF1611 domain-containing protein [Lentisphaeria bacterium]|nr:DUF1611 domain-containing protein [Lentisphaeria bacterium]
MLTPEQPLALYMAGHLGSRHGKMGHGVLRFSPNPVVCVVDPAHAGRTVCDVIESPRNAPVVATVREARALGAWVLVLGIAPSGGRLPESWYSDLDEAVRLGMSLVNGLHDSLAPRYPDLRPGQFAWDIRREPPGIGVASGRARLLPNRRVLAVGTDMACGKMTAGLLLVACARARGIRTEFLATGQIGVTVWGSGIALDAVRLDYACGAVEMAVLERAECDLLVVEGQGSVLHPGSSATLPLIRGACPTDLILCHRAGMQTVGNNDWVRIPPLGAVAALYEAIAAGCGALPGARTVAVSLNTQGLTREQACETIRQTEAETGLPTTDPVRFGADILLDALGTPAMRAAVPV